MPAQVYCTINITDLANVDFSQVFETSENTIRKNVAEDEFLIKFDVTPSFIPSPVEPLQTLTYSEALALMKTSEWEYP